MRAALFTFASLAWCTVARAEEADTTASATQQAPPQAAPLVPDLPMPGSTMQLFEVAAALCLLLAVIFLAFYLVRRFGPRVGMGGFFSRGSLQLESQLALGPRKGVAVVRYGGKHLVLGITDSSIRLLTTLSDAEVAEAEMDDAPPQHTPTTSFSRTLQKAQADDPAPKQPHSDVDHRD